MGVLAPVTGARDNIEGQGRFEVGNKMGRAFNRNLYIAVNEPALDISAYE